MTGKGKMQADLAASQRRENHLKAQVKILATNYDELKEVATKLKAAASELKKEMEKARAGHAAEKRIWEFKEGKAIEAVNMLAQAFPNAHDQGGDWLAPDNRR